MESPCPQAAVRRTSTRLLGLAACSLALALAPALLAAAQARGAIAQTDSQAGLFSPAAISLNPSATLLQCVTSVVQGERSATFSGEMTAIPGTAHMAMRIDLEERLPGEVLFHTVSVPAGLSMGTERYAGLWRGSEPKVKVYKYVKQFTNLSSPAVYRASVRFRWLNSRGHIIRRAERLTPKCAQPPSPRALTPASPEGSSPPSAPPPSA
jgi:hypothetical protein